MCIFCESHSVTKICEKCVYICLFVRSTDGLFFITPKQLVFSKTSASKTQYAKLKLKNRDQKTVVVNLLLYCQAKGWLLILEAKCKCIHSGVFTCNSSYCCSTS